MFTVANNYLVAITVPQPASRPAGRPLTGKRLSCRSRLSLILLPSQRLRSAAEPSVVPSFHERLSVRPPPFPWRFRLFFLVCENFCSARDRASLPSVAIRCFSFPALARTTKLDRPLRHGSQRSPALLTLHELAVKCSSGASHRLRSDPSTAAADGDR
jgi:hypothetical protein